MAGKGDSRTLNFVAQDLPKDVSLCLTFTPMEEGKMYTDMIPNCWKVLKLRAGIKAGKNQNAEIVYTADTGLLVPQVGVIKADSGDMVSAGTARRCQAGQLCELKTDDHGDNYLLAAREGTKDVIQCKVDTEYPASVAFGIFNKEGTKLDPFCTWRDVAKGSNLSIKVNPTLKIYAMSDHKNTQMIPSELRYDVLIEQNILHLPPQSEFKVSVDHNSHALKIEKSSHIFFTQTCTQENSTMIIGSAAPYSVVLVFYAILDVLPSDITLVSPLIEAGSYMQEILNVIAVVSEGKMTPEKLTEHHEQGLASTVLVARLVLASKEDTALADVHMAGVSDLHFNSSRKTRDLDSIGMASPGLNQLGSSDLTGIDHRFKDDVECVGVQIQDSDV